MDTEHCTVYNTVQYNSVDIAELPIPVIYWLVLDKHFQLSFVVDNLAPSTANNSNASENLSFFIFKACLPRHGPAAELDEKEN